MYGIHTVFPFLLLSERKGTKNIAHVQQKSQKLHFLAYFVVFEDGKNGDGCNPV